jgi:hypothetical protein
MYRRIVGIVVFWILIFTSFQALGMIHEKEIHNNFGICGNSSNEICLNRFEISNRKGTHFMQLPYDDFFGDWIFFASDLEYGWKSYDDFWDISGPICNIHWWGQCLNYTDYWFCCDPSGMEFKIDIYSDENGKPGTLLCSYESLKPFIYKTGFMYYYPPSDRFFELYYFTICLDQKCEVSNGWISIQSTYCPSGGWFMWMNSPDGNKKMFQFYDDWIFRENDVSYIMFDDDPDIADLECEGNLHWDEVVPGSNLTGSFKIRNNGKADSILHWKIVCFPKWGNNWDFIPYADIQTTDMDWVTIDVSMTAPVVTGREYTGKIKVVNAADPSDFCEVDVYLKTPRCRYKHNILFFRLIEKFSNALYLLQQF